VARTAATFCPTNGHQGGVLPQRPLHRLIRAGRVSEHLGRDGVELRLIAAAHEFGHIAQSGLRRLEVGADVHRLVEELRREEPAGHECRDQEQEDAQNPRPDTPASAGGSLVDERVVGTCIGHP
jgi:hypothetical protein